jgi:hypothetical protein
MVLTLARDGQYALGARRLWEQGAEALKAGNEGSGAGVGDTGSGAEADDTGSEAGDGGFGVEDESLRPLDGLSTPEVSKISA